MDVILAAVGRFGKTAQVCERIDEVGLGEGRTKRNLEREERSQHGRIHLSILIGPRLSPCSDANGGESISVFVMKVGESIFSIWKGTRLPVHSF